MASIFKDASFQENLVAFLCKDKHFLKRMEGLLTPEDFKPKKGEDSNLYLIAKTALKFFDNYKSPIGGLLRTEMMDIAHDERLHPKSRTKLLDLVDKIQRNHNMVAVEAIESKVMQYKHRKIRRDTVAELAEKEEDGRLNNRNFREIVEKTLNRIGGEHRTEVIDYASSKRLKERIRRRKTGKLKAYPYFLIDELDTKIKSTPRGTLGLLLAKYNVGKTAMFVHLAIAFAIQSFNVLIVTLEDGADEYEDRLDGNLTNTDIKSLADKSKRLRRRFRKIHEKLRGRIKIVDGSEGGMTVGQIKQIWEQERNRGFTADAILIDYDEEIEPVVQYKGETAKIMRFTEVYRDLRRMAKKTDTWVWVAAQAKRGKVDPKGEQGEKRQVVTGDATADDIGKVRKAWLGLGIGMGGEGTDSRHLFVMRHRSDQARFGVTLIGDFKKGIFYDREATMRLLARKRKEHSV